MSCRFQIGTGKSWNVAWLLVMQIRMPLFPGKKSRADFVKSHDSGCGIQT